MADTSANPVSGVNPFYQERTRIQFETLVNGMMRMFGEEVTREFFERSVAGYVARNPKKKEATEAASDTNPTTDKVSQ